MAHLFDRRGAEHKGTYIEGENSNSNNNNSETNEDHHHRTLPNTSLTNWWTEETANRWDDAADCFREQYEALEADPETEIKVM